MREEIEKKMKDTADDIFRHPELSLEEKQSSRKLAEFLESEGFSVQWGTAGFETAFTAQWGKGKPVIGFLAEYDALPGLGQACVPKQQPDGKAGHGGGHNLLGAACAGAACELKDRMSRERLQGTIRVYGCPAEEIVVGKIRMNEQGVFDNLSVAVTWHPFDRNRVSYDIWQAQDIKNYRFYGTAAHASKHPEMGRSALDAAELMNVGVQFLREHVPTDTRIHYAITDTGGNAPGVVQSHAQALYLLRAVQLPQVKELYQRVNQIARGAAMMTGTEVEITFIKSCSNMLINTELNQLMQRNLVEVAPVEVEVEDLVLARRIRETLGPVHSYFDTVAAEITDPEERARVAADADSLVHRIVLPLARERQGFVSSDVGDVSWNCPVAQINAATMPAGVPMHSWQMVAVGKSAMAKKGMLYAAKVMAGSAIDALEDPEIIRRAQEEFCQRTGGQKYASPIPPEVKPRID